MINKNTRITVVLNYRVAEEFNSILVINNVGN